jgi:hypothetical protein
VNALADNAERLILLAPISPAATGNGLAMRSELFRRAAACDFDVETVVVPVAGRVPDTDESASNAIVAPADLARARTEARALVGDRVWRDRFSRAGTFPRLARAASPGLAHSVVSALATNRADAVHVMRSYLAPLGVAIAERVGARSKTLDLDDHDAAFAGALGEREEAAAYARLIDTFGAAFDALSAASPAEAVAIGERHGLAVEHIPNAVDLPRGLRRPAETGRRREVSLLFVANLTYAPNVEAASLLVEAILPRVRARLGGPVRVTLVGHHHPELKQLAGPGVALEGFVPRLRSQMSWWYRSRLAAARVPSCSRRLPTAFRLSRRLRPPPAWPCRTGVISCSPKIPTGRPRRSRRSLPSRPWPSRSSRRPGGSFAIVTALTWSFPRFAGSSGGRRWS